MRAEVWAVLRSNLILRAAYALPGLNRLMRSVSYWLVPMSSRKLCRVERGLAAGLMLELNPRFERSMWEGAYEPEVQSIFARELRSGSVFYDVGSGIGFFSCLAAVRGAKVYAFEPDEGNSACVERHIDMNKLGGQVKLCRVVVSSKTGQVKLRPADRSLGHGNAVVADDSAVEANVTPCITLDEFVRNEPPPTLCKIDVEGHESEVLKGARELFERARPLLICEVHDQQNEDFVTKWLAERNYTLKWLEPPQSGRPYKSRHLFAWPVGKPVSP